MALQTIMATSRIVVAGSTGGDVALVPYDESGLPDMSFNGTGTRILDVGNAATTAAVAIQSDNRIVAAGGIDGDFLLVRFDASGALDMTFDGGIVQTDFGAGVASASAVLVEPVSQDLIAVGHSDADLALARYVPGGTLDSGFGMLGRVVTDVGGAGAAGGAVLGTSADIFVVGRLDDDVLLAHYLAAGGLDPAFGQGGLATTNYLGERGGAAAVILLAGDLFFTGSTEPSADLRIAIAAAPDPVPAGQLLVYTVSVTNDGPTAAADVTVSSAFSPGAAFVASQGCAEDPDGAPTCSLGAIAAGQTVLFTVSVIANRLAPSPLTAQVAVTSSTFDRDPDDRDASAATDLEARAAGSMARVCWLAACRRPERLIPPSATRIPASCSTSSTSKWSSRPSSRAPVRVIACCSPACAAATWWRASR
jgi:uncharacterized delta-60 repeat protein/uncharacterized repeat protein (TIGR01451 family)